MSQTEWTENIFMNKRFLEGRGTFLIAGLFLLTQAATASSISIDFTPANQTVASGATANFGLSISGLGDRQAPSVGAYDLTIMFDPTILAFQSATFGDPTLGDELDPESSGVFTQSSVTSSGNLEIVEVSFDDASALDSAQPDSFELFRIAFDALAPGTSNLTLNINALGDALGNPLEADTGSGSVTVTNGELVATPEPSTLLMTAGCCAAGLFFRKRQTI